MRRIYGVTLVALDEAAATFANEGVVRASLPAGIWREGGKPTELLVTLSDEKTT